MNTVIMKVQTLPCEEGMSHSHITNKAIVDGEVHNAPFTQCVYEPTNEHYDSMELMIKFTEAQTKSLGFDFKLKQVS